MSSPPPKQSLSSPTSGNSPPPVLPTPSSSTSVRQSISKPALLKRELEQQLKEKEKQLQESSSGIGKNVLARQISQLQDRIKEIDANIDVQPTTSIDRLRSLERDISSYRSHPLSPGISSIRNKEKLLNQRSPGTNTIGEPLPSPSTSTLLPPPHGHDSTSLLPLPPPPTGSTPTKRRSKVPNTDRRNTDIEFATEIGQGLLLEVRKMQALLQEKEEKLRILENQKADLERAAEAMAKQMRQREENEEKLKEETWNLELAKQELVISVTELQTNLNKANVEQNRLAKQVNELRSEIEQLRDKEEKLTATIENMKQRHEQDMTSIRRQAASFQREKQEQTKKIEALTSELAIAKAQSRIGKHTSSENEPTTRRTVAPGEQSESDQGQSTIAVKNDQSPSVSPPSSPKQTPARNQAMEVETLKTSLAHAHRMVSNLRSNLHKEKMEKFEFKKLLEESRETIEQLQNDPRLWVDAGPSRLGTSSSTLSKGEDGQPRRSHKASVTSNKRRGKTQRRPRLNKNRSENGVYSYSSESDQESFDESDTDKLGFTSLSSELSQSQKKVYVDAGMNTDTEIFTQTEHGTSDTREIAVQTEKLDGSEVSIQTDDKPQGTEASVQTFVETCEIEAQTEGVAASEIWTQTDNSVVAESSTQTDGQPVAEISTQTDLPDYFEVSIQTEDVVASEIFVQTEELVVSETFVQTDLPLVTEISTQTETRALNEASLAPIFETPAASVTLEDCGLPSVDMEPEDPSVAAAALAAATATAVEAARRMALGSAVDQETQYDIISLQDQETQYEGSLGQDQETQYEGPTFLDHETQYDPVPVLDSAVQSEIISVDAYVQMELAETNDMFVQYEAVETNDVSVQSEAASTTDISVQSELVETNDMFVQSDAVETKDTSIQFDPVESIDTSVQSEPTKGYDMSVQSEIADMKNPEPVETKDVGVQYEENDAGLIVLGNMAASNERLLDKKDIGKAAAIAALAGTVAGALIHTNKLGSDLNTTQFNNSSENQVLDEANNVPAVDNKDIPELDNQNNQPATQDIIDKDILTTNAASPVNHVVNSGATTNATAKPVSSTYEALNNNVPAVIELNNAAKSESSQVENVKDRDVNNNKESLQSGIESKMYSQAETDALIASAVALALAKAAAVKEQKATKDETRADTDSAVVSQYSDALTNPDDDQVHNEIAIHVSPAENQRKQLDLNDEKKEDQHSTGPSVVYEHKPSADDDDTAGLNNDSYASDVMDIPARPSNPPPVDLLSKIGGHSSLIDSRSMSPISNRSYYNKGKAPYDPHLDVENHSYEGGLEKKPSLGASSLSTNYTNEQLQSITSSQYGPTRSALTSTDPSVINLITQTMIGDWLWKYTRRMVGGGISEKRHKRFFWIHPYTRTLYWSTHAPGVEGVETKAKSALIENVKAVPEYANNNGLPNVSLLIQTSQRQLKLTAPNMDKHETWFEAISYLLARNENGSGLGILGDSKRAENNRSLSSATSGSVLKRPGFRPINDIYNQPSASTSTHHSDHIELEGDDEPLEDVRMCCNGKHHVGSLEKEHTHRHHYRKRKSRALIPTA